MGNARFRRAMLACNSSYFLSQALTVPTDIQQSIACSCSSPAISGIPELLLTPLLYLMIPTCPTMCTMYPVAPAPNCVTHLATNHAHCCLSAQHYPDTLCIAVKASPYSKIIYGCHSSNKLCKYTG